MVLSLQRLLTQQPLVASLRPLIASKTDEAGQMEVVRALAEVNDDDYREQVLKTLVTFAEQQGREVYPDTWEVYFELKTPQKLTKLQSDKKNLSTLSYQLPNHESVEIKEDRSTVVQEGGTGHRTWEASLALTEYICVSLQDLRVDRSIELGAGTGLVSISLAKLGIAKQVLATDGSSKVVDKLKTTISENGVDGSVFARVLDWQDSGEATTLPKKTTIFAGDVLYGLKATYVALLDTLRDLEPDCVYMCNPIRDPEAYEEFKNICRERHIKIDVLRNYAGESADETDWMYLVSVPPIPLELIRLTF